ncbi:MAG TPA: murein biosynthesis integral membrane protein MurJ [Actinomycetota bacterium]|nr:murein biosynthesis integral membrane protein MurJ [Actinomycetota bacterium]
MVEEVHPTPEELMPPPEELPELVELPEEDSRAAYARNTAVMTVGTTLSRVTGFLRIAAQTAALGVLVGSLGDTYTRANTTPNIVYELILGGILTSIFVPVFVEWRNKYGREAAWDVGRRVLTLTLVVLSVVTVVGMIFAPQIMRLYLVFSDAADRESQIELGAYLLRWFMPQIVFYGIGAVASGLLNSERRFAAPMFAPVLNNLVAIATFIGYAMLRGSAAPSVDQITTMEKVVLGAGTTLGVVAMTVALWPSLRSIGFRWKLTGGWNHPAVRRLGKLSLWVIVYVFANQIAYLVINMLAGGIGEGRFQIYATAFIVFSLPHAIFGVSIFTALLPGMSQQWTDGRPAGVVALLSRGIRDTAVVIVPAAFAFVVIAVPIVRLLLQYGEAGPQDTELIARTLQGFALGLPFFSIFQLLTRTFYAMQDSRTPALVNIGAALVTILVDIVFTVVLDWDVPGLALGHAISYAFATAVALFLLRGRLRSLDGARIWRTIGKVVPAAALTAGAAWLVATGVGHVVDTATVVGRIAQVGSAVVVGLGVYLAATLMLHIEEVDEVKGAVLRRFRG